jgi:hypothetical protein
MKIFLWYNNFIYSLMINISCDIYKIFYSSKNIFRLQFGNIACFFFMYYAVIAISFNLLILSAVGGCVLNN